MRKTVVLGVTSGIAAFKSVDLVKLLIKQEIEVFVIMTKSAAQMISPKEFEKASGNKVYSKLFEKGFDYTDILKISRVDHIDLADKADIVVIAPATANIIAKIAHGIADDFLTTTLLAVHCPVIICPSMNVNMWNNPIVQENISKVRILGYQIVDPEKGMLACGYEGKGRLAHIQMIKNEVVRHLKYKNSLVGKKILVTAGGTIEKIDDVRYITNRSSGKMGIAIAEECLLRGAEVLLLRASSAVKPQFVIPEITFDTAEELQNFINENVVNYNIIFHVAAVSDFKVKNTFQGKIPSSKSVNIQFKPRKKIIDQLKKLNPHISLIAFKAEYSLSEKDLIRSAHEKLKESNADVIIANDVGKKDQGFESDFNEVIILFPNGKYKKIRRASKRVIAKEIIDTLISKSII